METIRQITVVAVGGTIAVFVAAWLVRATLLPVDRVDVPMETVRAAN